MPRTETDRFLINEVYYLACPLCRAQVFAGAGMLMPQHLTEGQVACDGSGRTTEWVKSVAALRLRAHP